MWRVSHECYFYIPQTIIFVVNAYKSNGWENNQIFKKKDLKKDEVKTAQWPFVVISHRICIDVLNIISLMFNDIAKKKKMENISHFDTSRVFIETRVVGWIVFSIVSQSAWTRFRVGMLSTPTRASTQMKGIMCNVYIVWTLM